MQGVGNFSQDILLNVRSRGDILRGRCERKKVEKLERIGKVLVDLWNLEILARKEILNPKLHTLIHTHTYIHTHSHLYRCNHVILKSTRFTLCNKTRFCTLGSNKILV